MTRVFVAALLSMVALATSGFTFQPKVVYGEDDRFDVYQVQDAALRDVADSTVAMINNRALVVDDRGGVRINPRSFQTQYGLCQDEPFLTQPVAASCSGFMVGEDLIATAGHCIQAADCAQNTFIFNYRMNDGTTANLNIQENDVYRCKEIVARELTRMQDYALVRVDRPIRGHRPVNLQVRDAMVGEPLVVIGHPAGLPTKIAGGATVRRLANGFYVANLDTYGGNSGSAVFNAQTLEVSGILVRGETDFRRDTQNACMRTNYCADGACRGEDVTHISYIVRALGGKSH